MNCGNTMNSYLSLFKRDGFAFSCLCVSSIDDQRYSTSNGRTCVFLFHFVLACSMLFFSLRCVGERPWWPVKCLNKGRKKKRKAKRRER